MKILISADMEGITGVTRWDQVTPGQSEYSRFRKQMTADVNAAVQGAVEGGADEIIVSDGHWNYSNILVEELDSRAHLNSGAPSPFLCSGHFPIVPRQRRLLFAACRDLRP